MAVTVTEVFASMRKASEKHGARYVGNLCQVSRHDDDHKKMLAHLHQAGVIARRICDAEAMPTQAAVLIEEVDEMLNDIHTPESFIAEAMDVTCVALAMLGIRPSERFRY